MNDDEPIAFYLTWTVYGTHLQGAATGWRKNGKGEMLPQPLLEVWHHDRLNHPIMLLNDASREIVSREVGSHCVHRGWHLWECNARTTHVHVVVTAVGMSGRVVRDQLKANCTRGLREHSEAFRDRPVWTVRGDWKCINSEEELERVIAYVRDAQDRKDRDFHRT
jgi:REP element-mobilizing transposase RayT